MVKKGLIMMLLTVGLVGCSKGDKPITEVNEKDSEVEVVTNEDGTETQTEIWEEEEEETGKKVKIESTKRVKDGKVMSETLIKSYTTEHENVGGDVKVDIKVNKNNGESEEDAEDEDENVNEDSEE